MPCMSCADLRFRLANAETKLAKTEKRLEIANALFASVRKLTTLNHDGSPTEAAKAEEEIWREINEIFKRRSQVR